MKPFLILLLLCSATALAQVAPAGFTANGISSTEIQLTWTHDGKGIDKFVIEKSTDGNNYKALISPAVADRAYTDKGLTPNTVYYYRMYSVSGTKNSTIVTAKEFTLAASPTGFAVTKVAPTQIDLAWNSGGLPTTLEYSTSSTYAGALTKKFTAEQTGFADGLTPNTGYYFRLKKTAANGNQESAWVETKAGTQDAKPATPTGFAVTGKNTNSIGVKWNAVSGIEGYQTRRTDVPDFTKGVVTQDVSFLQTTYTYPNLNDNTLYYMQVRAKNTIGGTDYWSDWSGTLTAVTDQAPPAAPSAVVATPKSPTQVDVAWTDNSDNEDNFIISRSSAGSAGPWTEAGRVNANIKTFTDNGALPNTTYYYQVCASNKTSSACAISAKINTPIQPPAAPSGLSVSIMGTVATLTWKDNATNESDYEIQRKEDNGPFSDYGKTGAFDGVGTVTDSKLSVGKTYCYRVRATNAGGPSAYSNEACAVTLPAPPNPPKDLQLTLISVQQVDLKWTDGGGTVEFEVQRAEGAGAFAKINTLSASKTTYSDNGVQQGKTYSYRINAINTGGSALSDVKTITIPTIPAAPDYALRALSSTQIQVDYKNNAGANATALELQYARDQNFTVGLGGQNPPLTGSPVVIPGLLAATQYFFRFRATNDKTVLASDWVYKDISTLAAPITKPNAPTTLKLTGSGDGRQLTIGWTDASDNETRFDVQYSEAADFSNSVSASVGAGINTFTVNNLQPCKVYYARVSSANSAGSSAWIDGKITLNPNVPAKATSLVATAASQTQINLTLTYTANTEDAFELEYAENAAYTNSTKRDVPKANRSESVTGLKVATPYWVRIRAKNCAGNGEWAETTATTQAVTPQPPAIPTSLAANAASSTQINLSWNAATGLTSYKLEYADNAGFTNLKTETGIAGTATTFPVQNLLANTIYYVRLYAINSAGTSPAASANARTATAPIIKPNAPTNLNLTGTADGKQITVTWTDASTNEDRFDIQYAETADFSNSTPASVGAGIGTFTISNLQPCRTYYVRVSAANSAGSSAWIDGKLTLNPNIPAKPATLAGTAASTSQINLTWTFTATTEDAFELEYADNSGYTNSTKRDLAKASRSENVMSLKVATPYWFRIRAKNCAGNGDWTETTATTQAVTPQPPAIPTSLAANAASSTQINLSWNAAAGLTSYKLEYADNVAFTNLKTETGIAGTATTFPVQNLLASTQYYFRLYAINGAGTSTAATANARTNAPPVTKPNAPTELQIFVDGSGTFVTVLWRDNADNETGYEFQYADNPEFTNAVSSTWQAGPGQAIIPGLTPCKTYWMRVAATNSVGQSDWLVGKTALTPNVPTKPASLAGTATSQTQINLIWTYTANTENALELEYATNAAYTNSTKRSLARANRNEPVTSLTAGTTYWFRLRGTNCAGAGDWLETTATTFSANPQPPAAPTNLSAVAVSSSEISLTWTDNANNEDTYEMEYSTNASFTTGLTQVRLSASASSTQLTGLLANTTYNVRVRAVNGAGPSAWLTGSGTTLSGVPTALLTPTNLRFATGSPIFTQLSILWNDVATNETGYEVWRSNNDQTNWTRIAEMAVNSTTFSDIGLRPGIPYFYRVRAVQNTTYSDWSNVITDRAPLVSAVNLPAEVRVYPNPASDLLTIDCPLGGSGTVQICSVAGLSVLEQPFTSVAGRLSLDLRALPAGLYVVVVSTDTIRFSTRLLKR